MSTLRLPRVAIIGRPNVGKSTLFNRLFGRRRALVHNLPGVTRDRLEEELQWWRRGDAFPLVLVDTGGVGGETFDEEIRDQVRIAVSEADAVVLVFDGKAGLTPHDADVLRLFEREKPKDRPLPLIGAVNKVDEAHLDAFIGEFYASGLEHLIPISAEHGRGIADLQEALMDALESQGFSTQTDEAMESHGEEDPDLARIAVVGRPNVGKSTFLNALLRQKRFVTSPIAGTTVDSVDVKVQLGDHEFIFIDTAGIRRKTKTEQGLEVLSVLQTRKALERANLAVLILDGVEGPTDQDKKVASLIEDSGCSVIVAVNKWDLQRGEGFQREQAAEQLRGKMPFLDYAPVLFMSAKEGTGFKDLGDLMEDIFQQRQAHIATREFTEWVKSQAEITNPLRAKFYMSHQVGRNPPSFVCHVNDPAKVHSSLARRISNGIREEWGFMGSPIRIHFEKTRNKPRAKPTK